jgi:hypothetical protein
MALVTYTQRVGCAGSSFWLALFALALGSPALAAETSADDPAVWAQDGRPLPEPEFLQPRLDDRLPPALATPAATAARLFKHIIEVERQVDWEALIALRKQLRLLSPELFSLYMVRRAPGDWRWQIDEG